jgi:hypothetical protein
MGKQHFVAPKFFYIADDTFSNWLSSKLWLLKSQDVFIFFVSENIIFKMFSLKNT